MSQDNSGTIDDKSASARFKRIAALYFGTVSVASVFAGFTYALANTKKAEPKHFLKGLDSGSGLAARALAIGTAYAVGGFSVLCFVVWKAVGAKTVPEFGQKVREFTQRYVPQVDRGSPDARTDFKSWREFFTYLADEEGGQPKSE